jgi:hypothetical protein
MPLDVAVAVVDIQGIAEKSVGQGGPGGRHALAGDHDGGLIAAELFQGGFAHDVGNRRLRSGDQRPQAVHEAAFGLVLNVGGQVFPAGVQREIDGM